MMNAVKHESTAELESKNDSHVEETRASGSTHSSLSEADRVLAVSKDEQKLIRKLDKRIMPIICSMYFFACTLFHKDLQIQASALIRTF